MYKRIKNGLEEGERLKTSTSKGSQTSDGATPAIGLLRPGNGSWRVMYGIIRARYGHG